LDNGDYYKEKLKKWDAGGHLEQARFNSLAEGIQIDDLTKTTRFDNLIKHAQLDKLTKEFDNLIKDAQLDRLTEEFGNLTKKGGLENLKEEALIVNYLAKILDDHIPNKLDNRPIEKFDNRPIEKFDNRPIKKFDNRQKINIHRNKAFRPSLRYAALTMLAIIFSTIGAAAYYNPDFRQWTAETLSKIISNVATFIELDYSAYEAEAFAARGLSSRSKGQFKEASEMFKKAMVRYVNNNDKTGVAVAHTEMGILYTATRDHSLARDHLNQALMYFGIEHNLDGMAYASINLGKLFVAQNQFELAGKHYRNAKSYYENENNYEGLGNVNRVLGILSIAQRNYPDALRYFGEAESWYRRNNNNRGLALTYNALASLFSKQGNDKLSRQFYEKARSIKLNGSKSDLPKFSIRQNFRWLANVFKENQNVYENELNYKARQETERILLK